MVFEYMYYLNEVTVATFIFVNNMSLIYSFRLFDWRPEKLRGEKSKHEKVVIIKNLFDPSIFDKEVGLILEYQQDLRDECLKCGDVRKIVIYDVSKFSFKLTFYI